MKEPAKMMEVPSFKNIYGRAKFLSKQQRFVERTDAGQSWPDEAQAVRKHIHGTWLVHKPTRSKLKSHTVGVLFGNPFLQPA